PRRPRPDRDPPPAGRRPGPHRPTRHSGRGRRGRVRRRTQHRPDMFGLGNADRGRVCDRRRRDFAHGAGASHRRPTCARGRGTRYLELVTAFQWRDVIPRRGPWLAPPAAALGVYIAALVLTGWFFLYRDTGQIVDQLALLGAKSYVASGNSFRAAAIHFV